MIFLDTHVVVWLYQKSINQLSSKAAQLIEDNEIAISPIVLLELQYLQEINRIKCDAETIIDELTHTIGLEKSQHPFDKVIQSALGLQWTRDPFDRIIVADAQVEEAPLLTKDKVIQAHYQHAIWD